MAQQTLGWSELLGMGIVTAAVLVVGLGVGWLIDDLAGTTPVFILIGLALGIIGAVAYMVMKFRTYLNNN